MAYAIVSGTYWVKWWFCPAIGPARPSARTAIAGQGCAAQVLWQKLPSLLSQVQQDGARLEHVNRRVTFRRRLVDNSGNTVIWRNVQKLGLEKKSFKSSVWVMLCIRRLTVAKAFACIYSLSVMMFKQLHRNCGLLHAIRHKPGFGTGFRTRD